MTQEEIIEIIINCNKKGFTPYITIYKEGTTR